MIKNAPADIKIDIEQLDGFFRGVCEENDDPLKAGRIRVRVFGVHTESKIKTATGGIPTNELPWAEPCFPISEGGISGFGIWSIPLQGSHVAVFFENGHPMHPRYFGSFAAVPSTKSYVAIDRTYANTSSPNDGFKDPDGIYPSRLNEPDVHRLARGVSAKTLVEVKNKNLDKNVSKAFGGAWSEPVSPFKAQYPHNFVIATHGGAVIELDSSPGAKRFQIYHPSNTYIECDNQGVMVIRNNSSRYDIVLGARNAHYGNNNSETIEGEERVKVKQSKFTEINVNDNRKIGGNQTEEIGGNLKITVGGNVDISSGGIINVSGTIINLNTSPPTAYTEVDFGNLDDEENIDDGLNIYPPVSGAPTPAQIARSAELDVSPTNTVQEDATPPPSAATPPVSCTSVVSYPVPDNFVLSPNFTAGSLSTRTALSNYQIKAQAGLTVSDVVCNLQALAENILESFKARYPTMFITSAFRWGSGASQHERGQAVDIQITGFTNAQYYAAAIWVRDSLPYDQLILEYGGNRPWLHCSFNRAGNRPSTASNKFGTRTSGANYVWGKLLDRA